MKFVSDDRVKYLGKRKSSNDNGSFYSISVCDADGQSLRFYCSEECYEEMIAQNLEFGDDLQVSMDVSYFNQRFNVRVSEVVKV